MNANTAFLTATQSFEAARQLAVPGGGREARMHGHGFVARVLAGEADGQGAFPGSETDALAGRLADAVAPLDYGLVNEHIPDPTDANMARWIGRSLASSGPCHIGLQSTARAGAVLDDAGQALVWACFRLEAAHRLPHVPAGHKCGRMHGHGFEVVVHARHADSDPDALTRAWRPVHDDLHLACLNDLPGLENPTSEHLAAWIWQRLDPVLPGLARVTVMETVTAGCSYDGQHHRIWKEMTFDSAVRLRRAPEGDPRRRIHGHTFTLRLHLSAPLDEVLGWVYDYGDIKEVFKPVFRELDHHPLHEQAGLDDTDPGSLARYIHRRIGDDLPLLSRIDVLPTPGCGAILQLDDSSASLVP